MSEELQKKRIKMGFMLHPLRLKILNALYPSKQLHLDQLTIATGIEQPQIGFYVSDMLEYEIVEHAGFREIKKPTDTEKGKAAQHYKLTEFGQKYHEMMFGQILDVLIGRFEYPKSCNKSNKEASEAKP